MSKRKASTSSTNETQAASKEPKPKWSQEESIAYECARDYLNDVLIIYSYELEQEEERPEPRVDRVEWLRAEVEQLTQVRRELRVKDHEKIAEIRAVYGPLLKRASLQ